MHDLQKEVREGLKREMPEIGARVSVRGAHRGVVFGLLKAVKFKHLGTAGESVIIKIQKVKVSADQPRCTTRNIVYETQEWTKKIHWTRLDGVGIYTNPVAFVVVQEADSETTEVEEQDTYFYST